MDAGLPQKTQKIQLTKIVHHKQWLPKQNKIKQKKINKKEKLKNNSEKGDLYSQTKKYLTEYVHIRMHTRSLSVCPIYKSIYIKIKVIIIGTGTLASFVMPASYISNGSFAN